VQLVALAIDRGANSKVTDRDIHAVMAGKRRRDS
jgi:hypothetical protein